jgi:hypothetical protein
MISVIFTFTSCSIKPLEPVKKIKIEKKVDYLKEVKPILDQRCVVCHSCYNSPCQFKLSSFEGFQRGASKEGIYDTRLRPTNPTRLFVDAMDTKEWREKGFFSLTTNSAKENYDNSVMMQMIEKKVEFPEVVGEYRPETEDLICPQNEKEIAEYFDKKGAHRGMPYGFPALSDDEVLVLKAWISGGANGPTDKEQNQLTTPNDEDLEHIKKWEAFFNNSDFKHILTARYLYEHLYLAHITFKTKSGAFYELVRSNTKSPKPIELLVTRRPYDDPKTKNVYYRFKKIHSTIVHKTHMVMEFTDEKLKRLKKQFIDTPWLEKPHYVGYDIKRSANPFLTYAQIPPSVRYQFLLDNSHFIVMTFIRGPVCRGQVALSSIHDHFWVLFQDPRYDITLQRPSFLIEQSKNLEMPIVEGSNYKIYKIFSDKYLNKYYDYIEAKNKLYHEVYPLGVGVDGIYKGKNSNDAPMLTVYRHFDSASVHKGAVGELPRTAWVIDYPHFERIYYSLVAGFDIFGNISHQANIRRFMDFLRFEGELNFISYMPSNMHLSMFKSWSKGDSEVESIKKLWDRKSSIFYKTQNPKKEFFEKVINNHLLKSTNITFDEINYHHKVQNISKLPKEFKNVEDYKNAFKSITTPGTAIIRHITDSEINNIYLRIKIPNKEDEVLSIVINRYHQNVNSMLLPDKTLDPSLDTLDFYDGFIGSYPNAFMVVEFDELPEFFDMMVNFEFNDKYISLLKKFAISRDDEKFWEHYDWFQKRFQKDQPIQSGLFDLNRYFPSAW